MATKNSTCTVFWDPQQSARKCESAKIIIHFCGGLKPGKREEPPLMCNLFSVLCCKVRNPISRIYETGMTQHPLEKYLAHRAVLGLTLQSSMSQCRMWSCLGFRAPFNLIKKLRYLYPVWGMKQLGKRKKERFSSFFFCELKKKIIEITDLSAT